MQALARSSTLLARKGITPLASRLATPLLSTTTTNPFFSNQKQQISPFVTSSSPLLAIGGMKPSIATAQSCPREFCEMDNHQIIHLAAEGVFEAM